MTFQALAATPRLTVDACHEGLFAGRDAVKVVMPTIFEWIEAHSEVLE